MYVKNDSIIQIRPILIGIMGLLIGSLVYLVDRPGNTYFIQILPVNISCYGKLPKLFGHAGQIVPAFSHAFAFSLIMAGILGCNRLNAFYCCMVWMLIDGLFECGQGYKKIACDLVPGWMAVLPFFENTRTYFQKGTFDILDLFAIVGGSLTAYGVYLSMTRRSSAE